MKVRLHEDAIVEAEEASRWYTQQQPGLGREFSDEIKRCLQLLTSDPARLPLLEDAPRGVAVRRVLMTRFPFKIIFEVIQNEVVVLAIAHGSRRPRYWHKRQSSSPQNE